MIILLTILDLSFTKVGGNSVFEQLVVRRWWIALTKRKQQKQSAYEGLISSEC